MKNMKKILVGFLSIGTVLIIGRPAWAFQEIHNVKVTDTHINFNTGMCTITIGVNHPRTNRTVGCNARRFSWNCHTDNDYRYKLANDSRNGGSLINIRYSEYWCDSSTNNMALLTAW